MITDDLLADARQPDGSYQFAESFAAVSGYTLSADLAIGNLECNFCGEPYAGKPDYRAPDSLAMTLSTIGFDLLQTANTCSIQNGLSGLQSTMTRLQTWASTMRAPTQARPSAPITAASCSRPSAA